MTDIPARLTCPECGHDQPTDAMEESWYDCKSCFGEHGTLVCQGSGCWNTYDTVLGTWAYGGDESPAIPV